MSYELAKKHLEQFHFEDRIILFTVSSATVELAAKALGCEPGHIAKSIALRGDGEESILILAAGDVKIDNAKFKARFSRKASMIPWEKAEERIGHAPGGVCPFGVKASVSVYADVSLRQYETVYPAAGTDNSAVRLTPEELFSVSCAKEWVDVCKPIEPKE